MKDAGAGLFPMYRSRGESGFFWESFDDFLEDWGLWLSGAVLFAIVAVVALWLR